jgi:hypothetical protein
MLRRPMAKIIRFYKRQESKPKRKLASLGRQANVIRFSAAAARIQRIRDKSSARRAFHWVHGFARQLRSLSS